MRTTQTNSSNPTPGRTRSCGGAVSCCGAVSRPPHLSPPTARPVPTPPSPAPPNPEKRDPVSQNLKGAARFQKVQLFIKANVQVFTRQGTVAATYRTYKGKRLGPYYQLTYRDQGRQHWLYLGRSEKLADQVREFLGELHTPRDQLRLNRRLQSRARAALRLAKAQLKELLAQRGVSLKGWEFRGVRKFLAQYYPLPRPFTPPRPIRPAPT